MSPRPDLFVVGAPRAGTTALHAWLAEHPDVFMSTPKEPHHFCSDIHRRMDEYQGGATDPLFRTEEAYLALFESAVTERVRGESSVYYLYSREAARRIAEFEPAARIVILLREPVEFMRSLHAKLRWAGDEDCADFERALALEEPRRRGERVPSTARFPEFLLYSDYATFSPWVELYRSTFGAERVKVLLLDDLQAEPARVHADVLEFLDVEPAPLPAVHAVNANVEPRSRLVTRYLRSGGRSRAGKRFGRFLERWNTKQAPRRPLADEARRRLQERFRPEVERLAALLERDLLAQWRYPHA